MNWLWLVIAGLFEIVWAISLRASENFTKLLPTCIAIGGMVISSWLLALALRTIHIGTAYAVWTGIGIIGTVLFGILFYSESAHFSRLFFLALVFVGIVGLKWVG